MTSPFLSSSIGNFPFSTNMEISHTSIPSFINDHKYLFDHGMKMDMDFQPHVNVESLAAEGGSSSSGVTKETNKKDTKEKKLKKHRYAFHTRSQVDILDDGYRWRKYGQKAVKNNKFPRSYYRCTHPGCNVKKQVQRLNDDEEVVVTTYEGVHSHSVEKSTDNFEHILQQMQIYVPP